MTPIDKLGQYSFYVSLFALLGGLLLAAVINYFRFPRTVNPGSVALIAIASVFALEFALLIWLVSASNALNTNPALQGRLFGAAVGGAFAPAIAAWLVHRYYSRREKEAA